MSDPFSVAGSAVGVVSLGLEVSKGLYQFASHYKGQKSETAAIELRLEELASCLENLSSILHVLPLNSPTPGASTRLADGGIAACASALENIRKKLGTGGGAGVDWGFRGRMKEVRTKLKYPFQRDDLLFLKGMVEHVQQNLHTALLALVIDEQHRNSSDLKTQMSDFEQNVGHGFTGVHAHVSAIGSLIQPMQARMNIIEEGVSGLRDNYGKISKVIEPVNVRVAGIEDGLAGIQTDVSALSSAIQPITSMPNTLSTLTDTVQSLQKQIIASNTSAKAIEQGTDDLQQIIRRFQQTSTRARIKHCYCQRKADPIYNTNWTFQICGIAVSTTSLNHHEAHCPHARSQGLRQGVQINISICSMLLRRKAHIALEVSKGFGLFTVTPSLRTARVVDTDSPGFKLFLDFCKHAGERDSGPKWYAKLLKLFATGEATPYDRLTTGSTLLHFLCTVPAYLPEHSPPATQSNTLYFIQHLAQKLGPWALEVAEGGSTCTDMAYMSTGPALRKSYAPLFTLLMRLGIPLTTSGADTFLVRDELPLWDRQDMDWDDILRCSPALKSLITRSSDDLQALLLTDPAFGTRKLHGSYPLELATRYGWKDGCIMLLKSGATIANSRSAHCATLLTLSIDSGNEQVLSMWLSIRKVATESQLLAIGSLESALAYASQRQVEWVDGILDAIVEQRSTLKKIARQCITDGELMFKDERVLDAGAAQIFDFLAGIDVDVHPSLRPVWRSLYCPLKYNFRDRMIVEKLYDAGFRDVAAEDYDDRDEIPSPLLHCAIYGYVDQCWWFVSKGVKMTECWPRSHVTALQCLGWGAGNALMATNPHQELQRQSTDAFTWSLFADRCTDDCVCGCSVSGCTFSTSFVKGTTTSIFSPWRSKSDILHATLRFAAPATRQRRSLARALIRSLTFWHLGLEHTCCDIKRVWYYHACQINNSLAQEFGGMPEAYFESPFENDKSPVPRHTPEVMQRIRDEDVYLLGRLEELVCDLDREYEALEMDIEEFILEHWCKTMEKDVAISVKQDEQQYGKGRREMGVALELRQHLQFAKTGIIGEIEDEDETHTGPEDTSLEESDGVDEFYDAEENW